MGYIAHPDNRQPETGFVAGWEKYAQEWFFHKTDS
jgi:hypothetical protein